MEEKVKRPILRMKDGNKIKPTYDNGDYYFYRVRKLETAEAVVEKLKTKGIENATIGESYAGNARYFVRVPIEKSENK